MVKSDIHSNLNEPIEEVEDEGGNQIISETIQKRKKITKHIPQSRINTNNTILTSEAITEELEDDDENLSENNFYVSWENHKKNLLTQDEQAKLMNEDSHSSYGVLPKNSRNSSEKDRYSTRKSVLRAKTRVNMTLTTLRKTPWGWLR